jgi:hypothetical protein
MREAAGVAIFRGLLAGRAAETHAIRAQSRISRATRLPHSSGPTSSASSACRERTRIGSSAQLAYTTLLLSDYGDLTGIASVRPCPGAVRVRATGRSPVGHGALPGAPHTPPMPILHFKAHTLYEAGETEPGRAYLAEWIGDYDCRALLHGRPQLGARKLAGAGAKKPTDVDRCSTMPSRPAA